MSLVRKNDQLYNAKVKRNGLRTGTRRGLGLVPCKHAKGAKKEASRCGAVPPYRQKLSSGSENWSTVATQATVHHCWAGPATEQRTRTRGRGSAGSQPPSSERASRCKTHF